MLKDTALVVAALAGSILMAEQIKPMRVYNGQDTVLGERLNDESAAASSWEKACHQWLKAKERQLESFDLEFITCGGPHCSQDARIHHCRSDARYIYRDKRHEPNKAKIGARTAGGRK